MVHPDILWSVSLDSLQTFFFCVFATFPINERLCLDLRLVLMKVSIVPRVMIL